MDLFIISVAIAIGISAFCSLSEASLYAVGLTYVRGLAQSGSRQGRTLVRFKQNMEQPITAILIVNTVANTAGAAIAGAQARVLFGESSLVWFSAIFTLTVLCFSEILPKIAGVAYSRAFARAVSQPLRILIALLYPIVRFSQGVSRLIQRGASEPLAPEEEVEQMAVLSAEEGSILPVEAELVQNVLRLNEIDARDIMTPRTVVFKASSQMTVRDVAEMAGKLPYARIPIHTEGDDENWTGLVLRRDILARLAADEFDVKLSSLGKKLGFVPETIPGHKLLNEFLRRREQLLAVVDEYGNVVGVVTLEDVMESLIGEEIVDETDAVVDMQEAARQRSLEQFGDAMPPPDAEQP